MENLLMPNASKNPIYQLAKKITETSSEAEKQQLFDKFARMVGKIFQTDKIEQIEDALTWAVENEEFDVVDIIMEDTEEEVCNILFTKKRQKYSSSMLLLPCMVTTPEKHITLEAIGKFQEVIQKHMLFEGIIDNASQFKLGAVRIDNETIDDLDLYSWWRIHKDIIKNMDTPANKHNLTVVNPLEVDSGLMMFHLVPVIIDKESNLEEPSILEKVLVSGDYSEMWTNISKELSTSKVDYNIMAPNFITDAISESQYRYQCAHLELLFEEYQGFTNIEMGFIQTEEEGMYCVFFLDNEGNTLVNSYLFETDGNEAELITLLVDRVNDFPTRTLWRFDETISMKDMEDWDDEDEVNELGPLIQRGHQVDLLEFNRLIMGTTGKVIH